MGDEEVGSVQGESVEERLSSQGAEKDSSVNTTERSKTNFELLSSEELKNMSKHDYSEYLGRLVFQCKDIPGIIDRIFVIADRFEHDLQIPKESSSNEYLDADFIGQWTRFLFQNIASSDPENKIEPTIIQNLYKLIDDPNNMVASHAIELAGSLVYLDNRNKVDGKSLNLLQTFTDDLCDKLVNFREGYNGDTALKMIEVVFGEFPSKFPEILVKTMSSTEDPAVIKLTLSRIANRMGYEEARKTLRDYAIHHPEFRPKYEHIESVYMNKGKKVTPDLRDIYGEIDFENYKPNEELNNFETDLLLKEIGKDKKILDIGAGTGRLLRSLKDSGDEVIGVDFVQKHAEYIKQQDPETQVMVASWHDLSFSSESFDAAYCLGRSILHNTTLDEYLSFLRSAHRVLKKEGIFIVDLPNPKVGHYAKNKEENKRIASEHGILYREEGSINDGPTVENSFDRLLPSDKQFEALAALSGFTVSKITAKEYKDADEDEVNENVYWKLTPRENPLSNEEWEKYRMDYRTSSPPLFFSYR